MVWGQDTVIGVARGAWDILTALGSRQENILLLLRFSIPVLVTLCHVSELSLSYRHLDRWLVN